MKKINIILLVWVAILSTHAQNTLTLSSVRGAPGDEVTVSLSMENTDAVSAIQVTIPLDETLTYISGSATVGNSASGHSITAAEKDGVLTLMVYSLSLSSIESGSGEIASFRLKLGNQPKVVSLAISEVLLTKDDQTTVEASTVNGTVTIACPKASYNTMTVDFGRIPLLQNYQQNLTVSNVGNEPLTITGLAFTDPTFSSSQQLPLTIEAGQSKSIQILYSPVVRGTVTSQLYVVCNSISKLNTITLKANPYAVNELHVVGTSGVSDEEVTVSLTMNNMDPITGFQFEFNLPDALKYVDGSFMLSDRQADHSLLTTFTNGVLRAISYSSSNTPFAGYQGEIASFKVRLDSQNGVTLNVAKSILTAMINGQITDVASDKYGAYIDITSPRLNVVSSFNMGKVPVTQDCTYTLNIRNNGNVPMTISRITFDEGSFSIDKELPLVIEKNTTQPVVVTYSSLEEKDFTGLMQIYCNDPANRLTNITITGNRFAPNYIGFEAGKVYVARDQKVTVSLDNYDPVNGLQFDVKVPETGTGSKRKAVYQPSTMAYAAMGRGSNMTVLWRQMDVSTFRYFCYSLTGGTMERGNDAVLTLNFTPTDALTGGTCTFNVSDITLSTENLSDKYAGTNLSFNFNVIGGLMGDVNLDEEIDVADVVGIARNVVSLPAVTTFEDVLADVNEDELISVADGVVLVNQILGDQNFVKERNSQTMRNANDQLSLQSDGELGFSLCLSGETPYTAFQFDLYLPEGADDASVALNADRKNKHQLLFNKVGENHYKVAVLSLTNKCFNGSEGELLSINLGSDFSGNVRVSDIHFITPQGADHQFADLCSNGDATDLQEIKSASENILSDEAWYTISGMKLSGRPITSGIYIHKGKKYILR